MGIFVLKEPTSFHLVMTLRALDGYLCPKKSLHRSTLQALNGYLCPKKSLHRSTWPGQHKSVCCQT